jgi:hypothetical protein
MWLDSARLVSPSGGEKALRALHFEHLKSFSTHCFHPLLLDAGPHLLATHLSQAPSIVISLARSVQRTSKILSSVYM